jgi:hypothetical protein
LKYNPKTSVGANTTVALTVVWAESAVTVEIGSVAFLIINITGIVTEKSVFVLSVVTNADTNTVIVSDELFVKSPVAVSYEKSGVPYELLVSKVSNIISSVPFVNTI